MIIEEKSNLLCAFEEIWNKAEDSELTPEFFNEIEEPAKKINLDLGINKMQCVILSVLLDRQEAIAPREISRHVNCTNIKMLTYEQDYQELCRRKMICKSRIRCLSDDSTGYRLDSDFLKALKEGKHYEPADPKDFTAETVLDKIGEQIKILNDEPSLYDATVEQIRSILNETTHLAMSKQIIDISLLDNELLLLMTAAYLQIVEGHAGIGKHDYGNILMGSKCRMQFLKNLNSGNNVLAIRELLENDTDNGMAIPNCFKITEKAAKTMFAELNYDVINEQPSNDRNLILPDNVNYKELFYNTRESGEVKRLNTLLEEDSFQKIQSRLREANMRPGFTCLFYGAPGTGKTETALQLCKQTGRPIMIVDVADLKSKWVGESEKRVQSLFEYYSKLVQTSKICPILLFNEADAIISKRSTNVDRAVDKMENALQNIILQAMETLNGIMIATTNLTENMDDAFERRFLYKIRFDKPDASVRSKIWTSMLGDLSEDDALKLSARFDFSGGQIENIARKQIVDKILYDNATDFDSITKLCEAEHIRNMNSRRPIGF